MSPQTRNHWYALAVVILSQKPLSDVIEMIDAEFDAAFLQANPGIQRDTLTSAFCDYDAAAALAKSLIDSPIQI
jgi:hypothetical protein